MEQQLMRSCLIYTGYTITLSAQVLAQAGLAVYAVNATLPESTPNNILQTLQWVFAIGAGASYIGSQDKRIYLAFSQCSYQKLSYFYYTDDEYEAILTYSENALKNKIIYKGMLTIALLSALINGFSAYNGITSLSKLHQSFRFFETSAMAGIGAFFSALATFFFFTAKALSNFANTRIVNDEPTNDIDLNTKGRLDRSLTWFSVLTTSLLTVAFANAAFPDATLLIRILLSCVFIALTAPINYYAFDSVFYDAAFTHWIRKKSYKNWHSCCDGIIGIAQFIGLLILTTAFMLLNFSVAFDFIFELAGLNHWSTDYIISPLLALPASLGQINVMFIPSEAEHQSEDIAISQTITPINTISLFASKRCLGLFKCCKKDDSAHPEEQTYQSFSLG